MAKRKPRPEGWTPASVLGGLAAGKAEGTIAREWSEETGLSVSLFLKDIKLWRANNGEFNAACEKLGLAPVATASVHGEAEVKLEAFIDAYRATLMESQTATPDFMEACRRADIHPAEVYRRLRKEDPFSESREAQTLQKKKREIDQLSLRLQHEIGAAAFSTMHDSMSKETEPYKRARVAHMLIQLADKPFALPPSQHRIEHVGNVEINHRMIFERAKPRAAVATTIQEESARMFLEGDVVDAQSEEILP